MTFHINRLATLSAAAATSVLLLAGCGASTPTATNSVNATTGTGTTMPTSMMSNSMMSNPIMSNGAMSGGAMSSAGGMSTAGMPMPAQPAGPHNQADITFARQMSVHHQGAITMADLAGTRASSPKVKTLAGEIKATQAPELKEMAGWLAAWAPDTDMNGMPNKTAASMGGMGGMSSSSSGAASAMPGMMSDAQMAALTAANGSAFDKLFLQMMIAHHQGALTMATIETAQGQNPAALTLAKSITTSQTAQITQMQDMLKTM
jgi:uncharacterized protein (DUF305 family)